MDRYSLIVVADETAPIRRFDILKSVVHRSLWGLGLLAALLLVGLVDYVGLRIEQPEVILLRAEADAQRERLELFETTLTQVTAKLDAVKELERKVRIIANLPGAAATGGGEIAEVTIPDGVENAVEEVETEAAESIEAEHVPVQKLDDSAKVDLPPAQRVGGLRDEARHVAFGNVYVGDGIAQLHEDDREDIADFAFDAVKVMAGMRERGSAFGGDPGFLKVLENAEIDQNALLQAVSEARAEGRSIAPPSDQIHAFKDLMMPALVRVGAVTKRSRERFAEADIPVWEDRSILESLEDSETGTLEFN